MCPGRVGCLAVAQKLFNFSTLRRGKGATEVGTFERGGGGGEPQRARYVLIFGDGERKRAMLSRYLELATAVPVYQLSMATGLENLSAVLRAVEGCL